MLEAVLSEYPAIDPLKVVEWPMAELAWWYDRLRARLHARMKQD